MSNLISNSKNFIIKILVTPYIVTENNLQILKLFKTVTPKQNEGVKTQI